MTPVLTFITIATTFGALGVFLAGYRQITAASMRRLGPRFRDRVEDPSSPPLVRFLSGVFVAAAGSSASGVVSVVTMADGGAVRPEDSPWILAGINLGATFACWCIALIGFRGALAPAAMLVMAAALPFRLSPTLRRFRYGELLGGLALSLLALDLITGRINVPPDVFVVAEPFKELRPGLLVPLAGFLIGVAVSVTIRSSVGTVVLAMSLLVRGWLPAEAAAGAALGSSIGLSTIAFSAARSLGAASRRTAFAHLLTSAGALVLGAAIVVTPAFRVLLAAFPSSAPLAVVVFLTAVHGLNALILIPSWRWVALALGRMAFLRDGADQEGRPFAVLSPTLPESLDSNLLLTQTALARMAEWTYEMLMIVINTSQVEDQADEETERCISLRGEVKGLESEVTEALTRHVQMPCSRAQAERIRQQQRVATELSLLSDHCFKAMRLLTRSYRKRYRFHAQSQDELFGFMSQILDFLRYVGDYLGGKIDRPDWEVANAMEEAIDKARDKLKKRTRKVLEKSKDADIKAELTFIDIVSHIEHVGDRCLSISETVRSLPVASHGGGSGAPKPT